MRDAVVGLVAAGLLLLGAGTAVAGVIDWAETSRIENPDGSGEGSWDVFIDSMGYTVGAYDLFYNFDNPARVASYEVFAFNPGDIIIFPPIPEPPCGVADVCFGYSPAYPAAMTTLIGRLEVSWAPGPGALNLVALFSGPFSVVIDGTGVPIPGVIQEVVPIAAPEPAALALLFLGLAGLALRSRGPS